MKLYWKALFSLLCAMLLYWGMVTAFHLLNLPSDLAVVAGLCLLTTVAVSGWIFFRTIWRS